MPPESHNALDAARAAADRAVTEAKMAADLVSQTLTKRLEQLESGGAPFASRLDDSIKEMKKDVEVLKATSIRQETLDLRDNDARRTRIAFYVSVTLLGLGVIVNLAINLLQR